MLSLAATRRTVTRLCVAAVLLLAATASNASATCGDYVHVLPPGQSVAHPSDGPKLPPPDSPCAQGRCDRTPAPSAPSPAPAGAPGGQVLEAVLEAVPAIQPSPSAFGFESDCHLPRRSPSAIFHPPRS